MEEVDGTGADATPCAEDRDGSGFEVVIVSSTWTWSEVQGVRVV